MEAVLRRHFLAGLSAAAARPGQVNVREQGAAGDGIRLDTKALQQAVDGCAAAGGGVVYFPPGRYLSGTLYLKSNVTLYLERGAVLVGSKNLEDYPVTVAQYRSYTDNYTERSLIYGENLENVGLEGPGVLDGQGAAFKGEYKVRPYMLRMIGCRGVTVSGVTLKDSPMWVQHYLVCENVYLRGITVTSRVNANNDGIDIDSCDRVRIADCDISSGDDAIVLKSTSARACRRVTVTNCVLSTSCNNIKLGTESSGDFKNLAFSNCVMFRRPGARRPISGVSIESVDGSHIDGIVVSNLAMQDVDTPVFIRLGNRGRGLSPPVPGSLANVSISNLVATGALRTCPIAGLPGHPVRGVTLSDINITFQGGEQTAGKREVPEYPEKYPEATMFGLLPAYGLWARHVEGLTLRNVRLRTERADARPALLFDDVAELAGP